jgi:hypothetical protein
MPSPAVRQLEGAYAARGLRVLYVDSPAENSGIADAYVGAWASRRPRAARRQRQSGW